MNNIESKYNELITRLAATVKKEHILKSFIGLIYSVSIFTFVLSGLALIENFTHGDENFRTGLYFISIASFIGPFIMLVMPHIFKGLGVFHIEKAELTAIRVGNNYSDIKDRFVNALELYRESDSSSSDLAQASFTIVANELDTKDFDVIIEKHKIKTAFMWFGISILPFVIGLVFTSGHLFASIDRIIRHDESFVPPAPFELIIEDCNKNILQGDDTRFVVKAEGIAPETIRLKFKEINQESYDELTLKLDTGNIYQYELKSLKQTYFYFAEADWQNSIITTKICTVNVINRPIIKAMNGKIYSPSYTKLSPKVFDEQSADLTVLSGSMIDFNIISGKELDSAWLVTLTTKIDSDISDSLNTTDSTADHDRRLLKLDGKKASIRMQARSNVNYYFEIKDKEGLTNVRPIVNSIYVIKDASPSIRLIEPTQDVQVNEDALLPIKVAISDDYGFSKLELHYRLIYSSFAPTEEKFTSTEIGIFGNELALEVPYLWNLNEIGITPEDNYEFYFEIFDNDIINGPKSARTQTLIVRLPSLAEVMKELDEDHENIDKALKELINESQELKEEIEEFKNDLRKNLNKEELEWDEKKRAENILKKQQELNAKANSIKENISEATQKMQDNKMLSQETLEKYMELQRMIDRLNDPNLKALQKEFQKAMEQMTPDQMKKAMENFEFNEEEFKKSIERTMKILKRMQAEQKTDALKKQAEELAEQLEDMEKKAEDTNPNDKEKLSELTKKTEQIKKDMENLDKNANDLNELLSEIDEQELQNELQEAQEELNNNEMQQDMQQAQKQMQKGQMSQAKQKMQKSKDKMKKFASKMSKMKQNMQNKITKEAIDKMQKSINDLLELSKNQESLKNQTAKTDYNSLQLPQIAQNQARIQEALNNVANSMMELSEKTMAVTPEMAQEIGDAMQMINQSMQQLSNRNTRKASSEQGMAMGAMNRAISQMQNMLSQMQSGGGTCPNPGGSGMGQGGGGGAQGFGEKLQQMAAQQQMINQSMQQLMQRQGQGSSSQGNSSEQQSRGEKGRLTDKQGQAAKGIEELAKEQKELGGDDRKTLGDLEKIAKEMKEVLKDMESGNFSNETLNKQNRILSRLLDASKSINNRDFEKKREAKTGKDYSRQSPKTLDMNDSKKKAFEELMRSLKQGYTKDYEKLIMHYFNSLQTEITQ